MTYAELQSLVAGYLHRDDLTARIPYFINNAMHSLERRHNLDHMKVRYDHSLVAGDYQFSIPIPRFKELISAILKDSNGLTHKPLDKVQYEFAMGQFPNLTDQSRPLMISEVPSTETDLSTDAMPSEQFLLRPTVEQSYTLQIFAYQYSPDLDGSTYTSNWWTVNAPELILYSALKEAEPFMLNDERMVLWDSRMKEELLNLKTAQKNKDVAGRYLVVGQRNASFSRRSYDINSDT